MLSCKWKRIWHKENIIPSLNNYVLHLGNPMAAIIALLKPVLISFLSGPAVRGLVVDLLRAYSNTTDNSIDDQLVNLVADALGVKR